MQISVEEAEPILESLLDSAEKGEEIVLTLEGRPAVRLKPVSAVETESKDT